MIYDDLGTPILGNLQMGMVIIEHMGDLLVKNGIYDRKETSKWHDAATTSKLQHGLGRPKTGFVELIF